MSDERARPLPPSSIKVSNVGGSIYDLGYQRYGGPRFGRRSAVVALFAHTVRSCYGIGRGGRAKIAPFIFAGLAIMPAILAVGIAALAAQAGRGGVLLEDVSPIKYSTYHGVVVTLVMLFCASQGPELFGRDQRYGVLPLYFSRVLARVDYALAKLGGLFVALLMVEVAPYLILLVGRVLVAKDPLTGIAEEAGDVPRFLLQALLSAGLLSALAGLVAAWTPRRAYATATIIAILIIPPIIVTLVANQANHDLAAILVLFSPSDVLDGTNSAIFGTIAGSATVAALDLPGWIYVAAAAAVIAGAVALTMRRYLRIAT